MTDPVTAAPEELAVPEAARVMPIGALFAINAGSFASPRRDLGA